MKKLIGITLAVIMGLSISTLCSGDEGDVLTVEGEVKEITVTLDVPEVFGFQIWTDEYNQTIYPYDVVNTENMLGKLHIYVTTNKGVLWAINATGTPCTSVDAPGVKARLQISTYGITGGADPAPVYGETVTDEILEEGQDILIYVAGDRETNVRGLLIHGLFAVPDSDCRYLTKGIYTGGITLSMTPLGP